MSAGTAELVMSLFADGTNDDRLVTTDLVIDELDSWVNPSAAQSIPCIWSIVIGAPTLEVRVP